MVDNEIVFENDQPVIVKMNINHIKGCMPYSNEYFDNREYLLQSNPNRSITDSEPADARPSVRPPVCDSLLYSSESNCRKV